jgi:hypothetical protein
MVLWRLTMQAAADSATKERKNSHKNGTCLGQNWVTLQSHTKNRTFEPQGTVLQLNLPDIKKEPSMYALTIIILETCHIFSRFEIRHLE